MKKEVILTDKEIKEIKDYAQRNWTYDTHTGTGFLSKCIIKAFLGFTNKNNYIVENGRIYEKKQNIRNN